MTLILKLLRDPVWQAIGALIGVIAVFVSLSTTPVATGGGELAVAHFRQESFSQYWLPNDRVKLNIKGSTKDLNNAVVDYFLIVNKTGKPIVAKDYVSAINVRKGEGTKNLLAVESCSKPLAQQCSPDGASTGAGAAYVSFEWAKKDTKWEATPVLLNAGDVSCVAVISESSREQLSKITERFEWSARVTNAHFRVYGSEEESKASKPSPFVALLSTSVQLNGFAAYWFVFLQAALFVVTAFLGAQSGWISHYSFTHLIRLLLVVVLATATSEILIDIFINNRRGDALHPIAWPLVIAHGAFIFYLAFLTLRNRVAQRL